MFSGNDPNIVTLPNNLALKWFLELPSILVNVLEANKMDKGDAAVQNLLTDGKFLPALDDKGNYVDCLPWWISISKKYATVLKIVRAVVSIFHGPHIESSFSKICDIMDRKLGRMNMEIQMA